MAHRKKFQELANTIGGIMRKVDSLVKREMKSEDELLDTRGVMQFLKASRQSIHNWSKRGIIRKRKLGKRNYFLKSELIEASARLIYAGGSEC